MPLLQDEEKERTTGLYYTYGTTEIGTKGGSKPKNWLFKFGRSVNKQIKKTNILSSNKADISSFKCKVVAVIPLLQHHPVLVAQL